MDATERASTEGRKAAVKSTIAFAAAQAVLVACVLVPLWYIVPALEAMFGEQKVGTDLPALTQALLALSHAARSWPSVTAVLAGFLSAFSAWIFYALRLRYGKGASLTWEGTVCLLWIALMAGSVVALFMPLIVDIKSVDVPLG